MNCFVEVKTDDNNPIKLLNLLQVAYCGPEGMDGEKTRVWFINEEELILLMPYSEFSAILKRKGFLE